MGEFYIGKGGPLKRSAGYKLLIILKRKKAKELFN